MYNTRPGIKPVNPKGDQSWIFIGRTDAEAEASKLWLPVVKSQFTGKDPDAGKDWRKEEKGTIGWDGWMTSLTQWTEFKQAPGGGGGEGSLACCSPWGHKESDTTEQLNWTGWPEGPRASSTSSSIPSWRQGYRPWVSCLFYYQLTKQNYLFSFCRFFVFHNWYFLVVLEYFTVSNFQLWCWRRLLRVPWSARRSNQSILKEISPGCSLEGLMLKLKLQYFGHLMQRVDSLEKTLMLGGIGGRRRRGWQRMRWLDGITDSMAWVWVNSRSLWWAGRPGVLQFMGSQRVRHDWVTELNWTFNLTQIIKEIFYSHVIGKLRGRFGCSWSLIQRFSNKTNDVFFSAPLLYLWWSWLQLLWFLSCVQKIKILILVSLWLD